MNIHKHIQTVSDPDKLLDYFNFNIHHDYIYTFYNLTNKYHKNNIDYTNDNRIPLTSYIRVINSNFNGILLRKYII